ncbi:MAG: hypothetical protein AB1793_05435 [Candidatus Thermoplasmatota archaeon]
MDQVPRSLRFFYFGNQCPHNGYLLARVKTVAWRESVTLHLHDVTGDDALCAQYRVFSPQMLIVNDRHRLHGPFSSERVVALLDDEDTGPVPFAVRQGGDVVRGDLVPLTPDSALSTCHTCAGSPDPGLCRGKAEWVAQMIGDSGLPHLGYLHMAEGRCVGGAEFLPSRLVPYPIPEKGPKDAFLTCVYASDEAHDYKAHPTERLLSELGPLGFDTVSVAASTDGVFPNGPAAWFGRFGFEDRGLLVREEMHGADIHLLQMRL